MESTRTVSGGQAGAAAPARAMVAAARAVQTRGGRSCGPQGGVRLAMREVQSLLPG